MRIRQRIQQHPVDYRKERGVRSNGKSQRQHSDSSKSRRPAQHAETVANVLRQRFEKAHAPSVAAFFFDLFRSAEFQPCAPPRFFARHTRLHVLLDLLLEMKPQLVVEFTLHSVAPEQRAQPNQNVAEHLSLLECLSMQNSLSCLQPLSHGCRQLLPVTLLRFELLSPARSQFVEFRAAI